jgi:hypothetical protein
VCHPAAGSISIRLGKDSYDKEICYRLANDEWRPIVGKQDLGGSGDAGVLIAINVEPALGRENISWQWWGTKGEWPFDTEIQDVSHFSLGRSREIAVPYLWEVDHDVWRALTTRQCTVMYM